MSLDLAERALRAAEGDEAEAVVLAERSGLARFAGSEVHQPTLIENVVVTLLVARDGRLGMSSTNRVDEDGLVTVDDRQETSVEGVYAAGDITPHSQLAVVAAAEGAKAAIQIHTSLAPAAWDPV